MKKTATGIILALTVTLAAACSSMRVDSDYDPAADFKKYKTFALAPQRIEQEREKAGDPVIENDLFHRRVEAAIKDQFPTRGLHQVGEDENPDLYVAYIGRSEQKLDVDNYNSSIGFSTYPGMGGFGYGGYWGPSNVSEYREGTLIIDLIDAKTKRLVWRGTAADAVDDAGAKPQQLREAIAKVMEKYPPEKPKS